MVTAQGGMLLALLFYCCFNDKGSACKLFFHKDVNSAPYTVLGSWHVVPPLMLGGPVTPTLSQSQHASIFTLISILGGVILCNKIWGV